MRIMWIVAVVFVAVTVRASQTLSPPPLPEMKGLVMALQGVYFPRVSALNDGPLSWSCFLAGRLQEAGYFPLLAQKGGEWWVVVQLQTPGGWSLVPVVVESNEETGRLMARVAMNLEGTGGQSYEESYTNWDALHPPPRNEPPHPVAVLDEAVEVGKLMRFLATFSQDPDGKIVLYLWDFGDGKHAEGPVVYHVFRRPGRFKVVLTVIDDKGASATVEQQIIVYRGLPPESLPSPGCKCGTKN